MNKFFKQGEIIYVPASTRLLSGSDVGDAESTTIFDFDLCKVAYTNRPSRGTFIKTFEKYYLVFCKGNNWLIEHKDVYPLEYEEKE